MTEESKKKVINKDVEVKKKETTDDVAIEETEENYQKKESDTLMSVMKDNNNLLQEIKGIVQNRLEYDTVKEKAFDKLYEEMRYQKESFDMLDRAVKPLLSDLLLLYDTIRKFESTLNNNRSINSEDTSLNLKYILEELMEILYRQEVIPIEESLSETFNSKTQKATMVEHTENKEEDFIITSIVRSGFTWRDKVLRPQEVAIKRFLNKE